MECLAKKHAVLRFAFLPPSRATCQPMVLLQVLLDDGREEEILVAHDLPAVRK
jgi:hypothetical protein